MLEEDRKRSRHDVENLANLGLSTVRFRELLESNNAYDFMTTNKTTGRDLDWRNGTATFFNNGLQCC